MPEVLARLALVNKRVVYDLLFRAAAATLLAVAANPTRLGAAIGGLMVLHTWGQRLQHHPHIHCVVPAGGLSSDGARWVHARPTFFLPVKVLRQVFRGKLVAGLREAFRSGPAGLSGDLASPSLRRSRFARFSGRSIARPGWSTRSRPLAAPLTCCTISRGTRTASRSPNHRLVAVTDDTVSFRWKDYRHGSQLRTLTLEADEFLRRFLLHVLPTRFVRIRYVGFLAPRCRAHDLAQCRQALAVEPSPVSDTAPVVSPPRRSWPCPRCGAPMRVVERLTARHLLLEMLIEGLVYDTS